MDNKIYFWDTVDCSISGHLSVELCHPEMREKLYTFDAPWEGNTVGYFNIVQWNGTYYLYYGANSYPPYSCEHTMHPIAFCLLESRDGLHFSAPKLNQCDFFGTKENNIVWIGDPSTDNFTVMVDTNPKCPPEKRFKALVGGSAKNEDGRTLGTLDLFVSPDGHHFSLEKRLPVSGNFDSQNTLIYDAGKARYILYSRKMSGTPESPTWGGIRTIRICYSDDLCTFSEPKTLIYEDPYPFEMYTNGIRQYGSVFIGTPTRYQDRAADTESIEQLPDNKNRHYMIERWGRTGTAMTDSLFMFSRDGEHFTRFAEAFLTPGPEGARNWYYGDCYLSHGHALTASPFDGAPDEISMYLSKNYRSDKACELWRCAIRQDGFACIRGKYSGGEVLTKEFIFRDSLYLNFSTGAGGSVILSLLQNGQSVYTSQKIFGDSIQRNIAIPEEIKEKFRGKSVQVKLSLSDASIYSLSY